MNRFHSKYHRSNHHTVTNNTNPDAGHDPIASNEYPFQGDFVVNGLVKNILFNYNSFSGSTLILPQSSNQVHIKPSSPATISTITSGLTGVVYTLTNESANAVTISNTAPIYVRGGSSLNLTSYASCNIKFIAPNIYSVW